MKSSFLIACVLLASPAFGAAVPKHEEMNLESGTWKLPSNISVARLEALLQKFSDQVYGTGFKYLGVEEDFFHGHMLFEAVGSGANRQIFPRVILYHTQEQAYKAHWEKSLDTKYDYLNVTTRNWLQWMNDDPLVDGTIIENARAYYDVSTTKPADRAKKDPIQFFDESLPPNLLWHYTVHSANLDQKKLGLTFMADLSVDFYNEPCGRVPSEDYYAPKGPITVTLPTGEKVCLGLKTTAFLPLPWPSALK